MGAKNWQILDNNEEADLSKASLNPQLSSTGLDEERQIFHVSIDRAIFKDPISIIVTVLEANGFTINLENILACLDHFSVGALVKLSGRQSNNISVAKTYLPCLQFQLPSKSQVGPTLRRFYDEIEHYEMAINELQSQQKAPQMRASRKKQDQNEKVIALEEENKLLKKEVKELKVLLGRAVKSEATANQALASQNILPNNIRLGIVRELNISDRQIILKSGRTTINIPMAMSAILPNIDDKCLVHIDKGTPKGCFFYETSGIHLRPILSQILALDHQTCKVRDINRRTWCIEIKNEEELRSLETLKRGDYIQLYIVDNKILRFETMIPHHHDFNSQVQEAIARFGIEQDSKDETTSPKQGEF